MDNGPDGHVAPHVEFHSLDTLWFQVAGTLCNLRCGHCFISCSPDNESLQMMETEEVFRYLEEAKQLCVKEIYYTGGEPFLHPEMLSILAETLRHFPTSILTNGLPLNESRADQLAEMAEQSRYSLEVRISLDDFDESRNDAVRGKGVFRRALGAYQRLTERGLLPILTVTEISSYLSPRGTAADPYAKYVELLASIGVTQPRIKIIPVLEMGMLPGPARPELVTSSMMEDFDSDLLQCSSSRIVAADGVYACPILVGESGARLSLSGLSEASRPCHLYHSSCTTCYVTGMSCKNY